MSKSGTDPGFFLGGGGPLRNDITPINHIVKCFEEYQSVRKSSQKGEGGGGCTPAPSP